MDGNKDAALKCLDIGKQALEAGDRVRALKFVSKAGRLDPGLAGVDDLLSEIQRESGHQSDLPTSEVTDEVSSKPADQSSVRRRGHANGSSSSASDSAPVAYTEEQVLIVRKVKKKRDYYEILEVEKTCTVEDIRKAYRKLSLKVHPDKNKAPGAEEAFKAVSKAFQCLSNEENRRKYDVAGSDEPVYATRPTRHRSQGFNGFYAGDVDAEEIFRNFFFGGGMPPSTQFRGFTFGNGTRPRTDANPNTGDFDYRVLLQLLPVLLVLLLSFLPSSDPVYALYQSHSYQYKLATPKGVPFYVKTNFEQEYPPNTPNRESLEKHIEGEYFSLLRQNCRLEMQRRQWGFANEMTHCDMLKRFENIA